MTEPSISVDELAASLRDADRPVVVDVRKTADFSSATTILPSALWGDPEHIDDWSNSLPRDKRIALYCVKGGNVCRVAATYLNERGFDACIVEGGIRAWEESGHPTQDKSNA